MKKILLLFFSIILCFSFFSCRDDGSHIYSDAEVIDVLSGGGEKIGEYSFVEASSEECTTETLTDWFYNYVKKK